MPPQPRPRGCVSLAADALILSQVLNGLEEVCTVMRSLSSVIYSGLLSGSLPKVTRWGKKA